MDTNFLKYIPTPELKKLLQDVLLEKEQLSQRAQERVVFKMEKVLWRKLKSVVASKQSVKGLKGILEDAIRHIVDNHEKEHGVVKPYVGKLKRPRGARPGPYLKKSVRENQELLKNIDLEIERRALE